MSLKNNPTLALIIKNDDIQAYRKAQCDWKEIIDQVQNYSNDFIYKNKNVLDIEKTLDDCDSLKCAIHFNADKIVDYLLNKKDILVNPYYDNYGWPVLSMSLKNNRYDYALKIINHSSFDPYLRAHLNCFKDKFMQSPEMETIIDTYLDKFKSYDFDYLSRPLLSLIGYDEHYFQKVNSYFKKLNPSPTSILDLYKQDKDSLKVLLQYVFSGSYKHHLATKLNDDDLMRLYELCEQDNYFLTNFFSPKNSSSLMQGLKILMTNPHKLENCFVENGYYFSCLDIEAFIFLEKNGFDVWKKNTKGICGIQYLVFNSLLDKEIQESKEDTLKVIEIIDYLIDNYPQKIHDFKLQKNIDLNEHKYVQARLLKNKLNYLSTEEKSNKFKI